MKVMRRFGKRKSRRGAALLEYVILVVGIAIFCTFGVLMFGKATQHTLNEATQVLSGQQDANEFNPADAAATSSGDDNDARSGAGTSRN